MTRRAHWSSSLVAATSGIVELVGGFLIAKRLGNVAHVIQRKCVLGIKFEGLPEVVQSLVIIVVVEGGNAFHVQTGCAVLIALLGREALANGLLIPECDVADGLAAPTGIDRDHNGLGRMSHRSIVVIA